MEQDNLFTQNSDSGNNSLCLNPSFAEVLRLNQLLVSVLYITTIYLFPWFRSHRCIDLELKNREIMK